MSIYHVIHPFIRLYIHYQVIHPFIRSHGHLSHCSSIYKIIYPFIKSSSIYKIIYPLSSHLSIYKITWPLSSASDVEFIKRSTEQELVQLFQYYDTLLEQRQDLENKVDDADDADIPAVYLSPRDRQILDWHFANLEFANASQLRLLSLRHWDQDDDFEFTGAHLCLRDGYDALPKSLAKGLDIRQNTAVSAIHYNVDG